MGPNKIGPQQQLFIMMCCSIIREFKHVTLKIKLTNSSLETEMPIELMLHGWHTIGAMHGVLKHQVLLPKARLQLEPDLRFWCNLEPEKPVGGVFGGTTIVGWCEVATAAQAYKCNGPTALFFWGKDCFCWVEGGHFPLVLADPTSYGKFQHLGMHVGIGTICWS